MIIFLDKQTRRTIKMINEYHTLTKNKITKKNEKIKLNYKNIIKIATSFYLNQAMEDYKKICKNLEEKK